jgi:hypothetical protein
MNAREPNALERRCRLLLRAYPAGYRHRRGEEILGTVLERVPADASWPPPREAGGLILGGMRARAAQGRREGRAAGLRQAALLGIVLALSPHIASSLPTNNMFPPSGSGLHPASTSTSINVDALLFSGLAIAAIAMTWYWRPRIGALLALGAAPGWYLFAADGSAGQRWPVIIGLAVFALLAWSTDRPPRLWLLLPVAVAALWLALVAASGTYPQTSPELAFQAAVLAGFWVIIGVVVLWIAVDSRPALAVAIALALAFAPTEMLSSPSWNLVRAWPLLWPSVLALGLAVAAIWRLWRHQARI